MAPCLRCGQVFTFNPVAVPSMTVDPAVGRQPLCGPCVAALNVARAKLGLAPFPIRPDAYEAVDEREL